MYKYMKVSCVVFVVVLFVIFWPINTDVILSLTYITENSLNDKGAAYKNIRTDT